jgi:hypothetical protein
MTILARARAGESKEDALRRVCLAHPDENVIFEDGRAGGRLSELEGLVAPLMLNGDDNTHDRLKTAGKIVQLVRGRWSQCLKTATRLSQVKMVANSDIKSAGKLSCSNYGVVCLERVDKLLGDVRVGGDAQLDVTVPFNIVSNLDNVARYKGSCVAMSVDLRYNLDKASRDTEVNIEDLEFGRVPQLGVKALVARGQDMPEVGELTKALKMPKPSGNADMNTTARRMLRELIVRGSGNYNILTRLVKGIVLALAADASGKDGILLDPMATTRRGDYTADELSSVGGLNAAYVWTNFPTNDMYNLVLENMCLSTDHSCSHATDRWRRLHIPADGPVLCMLSMGACETPGSMRVSGREIRSVVEHYAAYMQCEGLLETAGILASMCMMHDKFMALTLPRVQSYGDIIRPGWLSKHKVDVRMGSPTYENAVRIGVYAHAVMTGVLKEIVSSQTDFTTGGSIQDSVRGLVDRRRDDVEPLYKWFVNNVTGKASEILFKAHPLGGWDSNVLDEVNNTPLSHCWWAMDPVALPAGGLAGVFASGMLTHEIAGGQSLISSEENVLMAHLGVITNAPLYKRELALRRPAVDDRLRAGIAACADEGQATVVPLCPRNTLPRKRESRRAGVMAHADTTSEAVLECVWDDVVDDSVPEPEKKKDRKMPERSIIPPRVIVPRESNDKNEGEEFQPISHTPAPTDGAPIAPVPQESSEPEPGFVGKMKKAFGGGKPAVSEEMTDAVVNAMVGAVRGGSLSSARSSALVDRAREVGDYVASIIDKGAIKHLSDQELVRGLGMCDRIFETGSLTSCTREEMRRRVRYCMSLMVLDHHLAQTSNQADTNHLVYQAALTRNRGQGYHPDLGNKVSTLLKRLARLRGEMSGRSIAATDNYETGEYGVSLATLFDKEVSELNQQLGRGSDRT